MFSRPTAPPRGLKAAWWLQLAVATALLVLGNNQGHAADLAVARDAFLSGRYDECIELSREALKNKEDAEDWGILLSAALLTRGRYPEALAAATNGLAVETRSIRLRWSARQAVLLNGQPTAAAELTTEIQRLFTSRSWLYRNARDLVVFGRAANEGGIEPKVLLDQVYQAAKKLDPKLVDPYLASGELALQKHDFALAARFFQEGLEQAADNPDLHLGVARAFAPSDTKLMLEALFAALERNSNHVGSLLRLADHHIDAEDYTAAEKVLTRVDAVNPSHPEAWAYRAVIAHLKNQGEAEAKARETALKPWPTNPQVDFLIGQKLSQKYRFAEGEAHQRRALSMSPGYLPAKAQLAQDLLRLGEEAEGWQLADEVQREDSYDVTANNLVTLHTVLNKFQALTNAHFLVRMEPREAALYGTRVQELLERARTQLCQAYGMELPKPVLVELFNQERDFAVRTFGMPDNDGFLGVCFGNVITANSPSARPGSPFNWESMLWHEFCHVVTLQLTKNKMPRWLSEGISVYEERQANPAWGEHANPRYREMLLGKDFNPISKLSGAFLTPKSALHLQFAYYESSLVVQFLVEKFGREKLVAILRELAQGREVDEALAKHTVPMPRLEEQFVSFARHHAEAIGPGVDWQRPTPEQLARSSGGRARGNRGPAEEEVTEGAWKVWSELRPTNYWVMLRKADSLADEKKWSEALPILRRLVEMYPDSTGASSPYRQLGIAYRELGDTNSERQVLIRFAQQDDQAPDAYSRLMELGSQSSDWGLVLTNAERYLAVDPLVPAPYRFLAKAGEATGQTPRAIQAYNALLQLDPPNPAEVHFHLARLLYQQGDPAARRHVLQALEEAPRYREALKLLRLMRQSPSGSTQTSSSVSSTSDPET